MPFLGCLYPSHEARHAPASRKESVDIIEFAGQNHRLLDARREPSPLIFYLKCRWTVCPGLFLPLVDRQVWE